MHVSKLGSCNRKVNNIVSPWANLICAQIFCPVTPCFSEEVIDKVNSENMANKGRFTLRNSLKFHSQSKRKALIVNWYIKSKERLRYMELPGNL